MCIWLDFEKQLTFLIITVIHKNILLLFSFNYIGKIIIKTNQILIEVVVYVKVEQHFT